jgi:hypothetical protein
MRTLISKANPEIVYQLIEDGNDLPIAYHVETPQSLINVLERARKNRQRIKLYLGDIETGRDWHEEHDTVGYIGLSRGTEARFPILVYNERSYGGGILMDNCIVKVKEAKGKCVLYKAANYQAPVIDIVPSDLPEYQYNTNINGELYGRHKSLKSAQICKAKLS